MSEETPHQTPGWYPDPFQDDGLRRWDGRSWQERDDGEDKPVDDRMTGNEMGATILLPPVGIILGIVAFSRGVSRKGGNLVGLAILAGFGWWIVLASVASGT